LTRFSEIGILSKCAAHRSKITESKNPPKKSGKCVKKAAEKA
jgi:hypothetical protein